MSKFAMPPKKKDGEDKFIDGANPKPKSTRAVKEPVKSLFMRVPESLYDELKNASAIAGISVTAYCILALREAVKKNN